MFTLGPFRLDLISDGTFEDEADTFVRLCVEGQSTPRVRFRGKPRVKVGFNSLLIRFQGHTVVVDPGTGDKPREEKRKQHHLEWPRRFLPALDELGVGREAVDTVILTHLHWDHCGAATRLDEQGRLVPTFPNARYYVQVRELEAARAAPADDDGYDPRDFEPLAAAGVLNVVDGDAEILPGVSVRLVGGHSRGLMVVVIGESAGPRAIYLSDLVPTTTQLPPDCVMSYDLDIEELKASKARILAEAVERRDLLFFVHAPRLRAGYPMPTAAGAVAVTAAES